MLGLALAVVALLLTLDASAKSGVESTPIVVHVERGGFCWSDAAIGVLVGVGISVATCGCLALVRLRGPGDNTPTKGEQS